MLQSTSSTTADALNPAKNASTRRGLRDITNVAASSATSGKVVQKPLTNKTSKPTIFIAESTADVVPILPPTVKSEPVDQDIGFQQEVTLHMKSSSEVVTHIHQGADNIDARDSNPLMVKHYVQEIYAHLRLKELNAVSATYMQRQPHINEKMRAILIDWLVSDATSLILILYV